MALRTAARLTAAEFEELYGNLPGYEYWFGEARRKPVPTRLHGLLQLILGTCCSWLDTKLSLRSKFVQIRIGTPDPT
jgi:hypothetical protein